MNKSYGWLRRVLVPLFGVLLALASAWAHADENFVPGIYQDSSGNQYMVSGGAPSQAGRTQWAVASTIPKVGTTNTFNAIWETGAAVGNTYLAGSANVTNNPTGYPSGRSYGVASNVTYPWSVGAFISASQGGGALVIAQLKADGSVYLSTTLSYVSAGGATSASSETFQPGVYKDSTGNQYLVSGGAPSQTGRTQWAVASTPAGGTNTFNAIWETGAAVGNTYLAGNANVTTYPPGYAGGRSYGVASNVTYPWSVGAFISASQVGGTLVITQLKANGSTYLSTTLTGVNLLTSQTISFTNPGAKTLGAAPFALSATGGASGNPVTFTSQTTGVCTVSGSTATLVAAGTCTIAANQAGNASYAVAPQVTQSFAVGALTSQTIGFTNPGTKTLGAAPFALSATGGASGNPVTFTSQTTGVCTVSGSTATLVAAGTCTIAANQAGNASYSAAPQVTLSFSVTAVTSSFPGNRNNYSITKTSTGFTVTDKVGAGGAVALTGVTQIKFADMTVNLLIGDLSKTIPADSLKSLTELYVAFFNRIPDSDGLAYWIGQFNSGMSLDQIAESFYTAGIQYSSLTGFSSGMTPDNFINTVYRNVLGRPDGADQAGMDYWKPKLLDGSATHGSLVTDILYSAHTYKGDPTWGWVADLLDNKYSVASFFCLQQGLNYNTPEISIAEGMAIAAAVTPTSAAAAIALIGVTDTGFNLTLP